MKKSGDLAYVVKSDTKEHEKAVSEGNMQEQETTKKSLEKYQKELSDAVLEQERKRLNVLYHEDSVALREKAYIKAKNDYCAAMHQVSDADDSD